MNRQPILNILPTLFISTLLLVASASVLGAQEENRIIRIRPESGTIGKGSRITVYFTEAVVATDAIDRTGQGSPLLFDPEVAGTFLWKSQTEGQFLISGSLIPGQRYTVQLTPGLKHLDGNPVNPARWIDRFFQSPELTVTTKFRSGRRSLPQQPKISLMFNYSIRFADATRAIYFQDRKSRQRFASEILLPSLNSRPDPGAKPAPALGSMLFVQPAAPLPAGCTVDIVVDGLRDDATGTPIPHLRSFPLGKTTALEFERAYTLQDALTDPSIVLNFNQRVAVDSVNAASISVQPAVPNLKWLTSGSTVRLEGNFNPEGKYRIEMAKELLGTTGYALSGAVSENVEFKGITPSIYFPTTQYFTRPALGLKMKFLHANTGAVTWQLGRLPEHKIGIARARLFQDGERLIDQLGIKPVAKGSFPAASGTQAVYRDINWRVTNGQAITNGVYLLEVSAPLRSGKLAANRSIIFFNDLFVTKKKTGEELLAKVQDMSGSKPISNVRVRMVSAKNLLLATSTTDADGIARFNRSLIDVRAQDLRASHLLIDSPGGGYAAVFVGGSTFHNSGNAWRRSAPLLPVGTIIADRNLYRPGTSAKFKGFLRLREDGILRNAPGATIDWKVNEGYNGKTIASGSTTTDEFGGWESEWVIPKDIQLGSYYIRTVSCGSARLQVEEYRTPLFDVALEGEKIQGAEITQVRVQSSYFHGAPNAGAIVRWSLDWGIASIESGHLRTNDRYSQTPLALPPLPPQEGELKLDAGGSALIRVKIPEAAPYSRARYSLSLNVDVISPEGRTISNSFYGDMQPSPHILAIDLDANYAGKKPGIHLNLISLDRDDRIIAGQPFQVDIFRVETRTVKEQVGEGLYRYRNFDEYLLINSISARTPGEGDPPISVDVGGIPGRYVAVASLADGSPRCSAPITLAGEARAAYPVHAPDSFAITADKEYYIPGDTAGLALEAPYGGKAWVSMETDRIIEQFVVDIKHNASRIDIPIKPEYFPNVYATIHLVRAGGADRIPAERFGRVELRVKREDLRLEVNPVMAQSQIEPGREGTGTVYVLAGGQPVENADVTLMAVDEAVLQLGQWQAQELFGIFYPERGHNVATYLGLSNHIATFNEADVTEKGFVIGGGDFAGGGNVNRKKQPRRDFRPRAFWITGLRTDAEGKASFSFKAPDNMTEFRVTAMAQTRDLRFGQGQSKFQVNKRLMVEPALPRFVRHGDEIILRAITRHQLANAAEVLISCTAGEGLETLSPSSAKTGPLAANVPGIFGMRVRVKRGISEIKIRFDAHIAGQSTITDEVEITLPVFQPGIMQRTGLYGKIPGKATEFVLAKVAPEFWPGAEGNFGLTLSRSPFMPKLQGLPELLEYPHGCFEQRTSKLLGYTQLAGLLEYLPELGERHKNYRERIEEGLRFIAQHIRADGFLPYWPGDHYANYHVTVQAAWVVAQCRQLEYTIPQRVDELLPKALDAVIRGRKKSSLATRAFALFVHSKSGAGAKPVDVLEDLYLHRDQLSDEARAMLALAMHNYGVMPAEQQLLAHEIDNAPPRGSFDPVNFYSSKRAKAVAYMAQSRIADPQWSRELEPKVRNALLDMMDDSLHLSTQENLWLLMALTTMLEGEDYQQLTFEGSGADLKSGNGFSMAWKHRALSEIGKIGVQMDAQPVYYLVDANVLRDMENSKREDRGLRVERVIKNMTSPARDGSAESPFMLGDEILVTYRLQSDKNHYYIALVDELPAGLETVNFNLAQVAEFYSLPKDAGDNDLHLDHSELRDRSANLYFNNMPEGSHTYSMLARVTSPGRFSWPATSVTPMYEPRFGALGGTRWIFVGKQ
jgi:uncharacterized protein YfaS (alpha-2-macroglobulin family)